MNRRDFLKALGLGTGVTAAQACALDGNVYYTPVEQVLPYVTRPEQTTAGAPSNFATVVGTGPRAWPGVAVHRDGRVTNVGANRAANLPLGVSATSYLDVQRHWSPDRITTARKGGAAVTWEAGVKQLVDAAKSARASGKKIAWIGPYRSGTLARLLATVTGGNAVHFEPLGLDAEALAAQALFGTRTLPRYVLDDSHFVLSFGAPFLGEAWGNPGVQAAYAKAKDANHGNFVTHFVAVTPLKDQTSANADGWHACKPGSEAMVALAVAKLVARKKNYAGPAAAMVAAGDPAAAAAASGVSAEAIEWIATKFAESKNPVALPGGVNGASMAATRLAAATYLLNIVSGTPAMLAGGYGGPIHSLGELEALVTDMEAGNVGLLLVDDLDVASVVPGGRFAAALGKVGLAVSVSSWGNETNAELLTLPTHDTLEDWGDEEPWLGLLLARQPGARPANDTRSLGDLLLEMWRGMDAASAPQGSWRDYLWTRWATALMPAAPVDPAADPNVPAPTPTVDLAAPSTRRVIEGVLTAGLVEVPFPPVPVNLIGSLDLAGGVEASGDGAYDLVLYAHPFKLDGRYSNEPWAHETPDPMTGQMWDSWALVHPETATALGVGDNDLIEVKTATGSLKVGVEVHPCIARDTIGIALGGGATKASGRYADGVGVNVVKLLAERRDPSGAAVFQATKCSASPAGRAELISTFGNDDDSHRHYATVVNADEWSHKGDVETEHPGALTGIHLPPVDRRLLGREKEWRRTNPDAEVEKTEYLDLYPVPDHPTYRFAMTIDTNACNGCGACVIACQAENNIPVVGKETLRKSREMSWLRINRFFDVHTEDGSPSVHFVPIMCQQCAHAPCESVCPVLATYHTIDGLNAMIYNRCVGTRYCANACPYSLRRFNYHSYQWPEPFNLQLNPEVATRTMGVMEKCTFCVQRIRSTKAAFRAEGFTNTVPDAALRRLTACAEACPSGAITFGNLKDPESVPARSRKTGRNYLLLADINTFPAVNYLARASFHFTLPAHGGAAAGGHGEAPAGEHGAKAPGEHH